MNELPSSSESISSSNPGNNAMNSVNQPPGMDRRIYGFSRKFYIALIIVVALFGAQWWIFHNEIHALREEVAKRLQNDDSSNAETKMIAKSVQENLREIQAKVSVLESKQADSQNQQVALQQMYQDLSKNRDDWALAEIEQVLSTASEQLQLAGNVQGALIALQNADNRLAHSDKPQFISIRRAIARDQEKLKALPSVDITGIALRLDSIISQIDYIPLLSGEKPVESATPPRTSRRMGAKAASNGAKVAQEKKSASSEWFANLGEKWHNWANDMWGEVRQLIRIRSVDTPDALMMSPTQAYYVRENLKLRLLNARLALLSRNEAAFRSDLIAAQDAITKYFDTRAKQTQVVQALLKQVQGSNLSIQMPTLADSLNAVRSYKAKP